MGGPQIGYFYPGLTLEMDLQGPGWNARGATSAPFPGYILIGRREDFVWTLTSAGADIVDIYVETLCEGSDTKYLFSGQCRDMSRFDAGTLDGQQVSFNRTVHGPVVGYATVDGRRVAVSRKRSSYLLDGVDLLIFQRLTRGRIPNAREFLKAAAISPQTFNTFYADAKQVAQSPPGGCRGGRRAWTRACRPTARATSSGAASKAQDAPAGDPASSGVMNNWNNKPARGFPAADDQWAYGLDPARAAAERQHGEAAEAHARDADGRDERGGHPGHQGDEVRAAARASAEGRDRAQRASHADARAARGLARAGRQPPRPRPRREDRPSGRGDPRHGRGRGSRTRR